MNIKKNVAALVLITGFVVMGFTGLSSAATGTIYLSPATSSVQVGNNVSVALRISPGTSVNAVQATVSYNPSDLTFLSASLGSFSTCAQDSGGGGSVVLSCAELGSSTSSDSLIANITFQALASSGSTSLTISGAEAANNGTYTDPSSSGATVSFTAPPVASAPTQSSTSSNSSSVSHTTKASASTPTTVTATTPATVQPAASTPAKAVPKATIDATVVTPEFSRASISVTTNEAVQASIVYGTNKNNLGTAMQLSSLGTTAKVTLGSGIMPGTTYYYRVTAKNSSAEITQGPVRSFTTHGYTISVAVLDTAYHPLVNKTVALHSTLTTAKTNSHGIVTFSDTAPGLHHIDYVVAGHSYSQPIYILNTVSSTSSTQIAAEQKAAVVLIGYKQPTSSPLSIYELLVLLVLGVIVAVMYKYPPVIILKQRRNAASSDSNSHTIDSV